MASHVYAGSCHCGAIAMRLDFSRAPDAIEARCCQCGFCTRQGAITVSDPAGRAFVDIDARYFGPYCFATRSATSLICTRCGVYAGAILEADGRTWSIANTRGLAIPEFAAHTGMPMHYEHETADQRVARRKQRWTPTELRFKF